MNLKILIISIFWCGTLSAQKGVISIQNNPTTGQTIRFDGTKWDAVTLTVKHPIRMEVVDGNTDVPAPATLTKEVIRIPLEYNGYNLIGVNYSVRTTGASGDLDVQIRKNGSGTAGTTFTAGQGQKDVTLTGITVATGDLIDVEIVTNSMATPQKGLWVTIFLTPN